MKLSVRCLIWFLLAMAFPVAAAGSGSDGAHATLIGDLKSQSSPQAVKAALGSPESWKVTSRSQLPEEDHRPRFDWFSVSIKPYEHESAAGELVLSFFNERLIGTIFYSDGQNEEVGVTMSATTTLTMGANTRVDFLEGNGLAIVDRKLLDEHDEWIELHSPTSGAPRQTLPTLVLGQRQ